MSAVYNIVSQYLPFVRKKPSLSREQALKARPVWNPVLQWERGEDGEVQLRIPSRKDWLGKALSKFFRAPEFKQIALDEVGSDVWEMCDGQHSVEQIVNSIGRKYKITRRECEVSVSNYLKMLGDRRLVGLQLGGRRKK